MINAAIAAGLRAERGHGLPPIPRCGPRPRPGLHRAGHEPRTAAYGDVVERPGEALHLVKGQPKARSRTVASSFRTLTSSWSSGENSGWPPAGTRHYAAAHGIRSRRQPR